MEQNNCYKVDVKKKKRISFVIISGETHSREVHKEVELT